MAEDSSGGSPSRGDDDDLQRLSFPDLPRLELDQLLGQLVERAQEVMGTQGRLRSLLRANRRITGLEQPDVLRHAVVAARELVSARYAAIGVAGPGGGLAEFVHDGMDADTVARIGRPPHGKGLLGAVLEDPAPIRLSGMADDARSAGLPAGHPPMEGFLGVPIRVRGELFGAFYLVNSDRGEFTAEDEELLGAFAVSVGVAVDNARLYEAARSRGEWLSASAAVTRQLLSADPDDGAHPLQLIAERTRDIAGADLVLVLRPAESDAAANGLTVEVCVGADAGPLCGKTVPVETSLPGRVFTTAEPELLPHLTESAGLRTITSGEVELGPMLAVPLLGSRRVHGVLAAARLNGRPGFTATDLDMAASFANHAALAIELAEARAHQQMTALLDDRERIAADLHDHVVQPLFGTGLSLQGLAASARQSPMAPRLTAAVADLDRVIAQIRSTIFQLQSSPPAEGPGVRGRLVDVLAEARPALGLEPALRFAGALEEVPPGIVDDLLAVLREALIDVARHAGARTVEVDVAATGDRVTLRVTDDGRGLDDPVHRRSLAGIRRRAEDWGGECEVTPGTSSGTALCWSVPLG